MQAVNKYIVIKKINEEYKTKSGLLLSNEDMSSLRYHKAIVINPGTNVETYTVIEERDVVVVL